MSCDAVLVIFDVTALWSYNDANQIISEVLQTENHPVIGVIANKADMPTDKWGINVAQIK